MEGVPDLSALLKGKLQMLSTKSPSTDLLRSQEEEKKKDGKKRPREDPSIDQNEASTVVGEDNTGGPAQTGSTEASPRGIHQKESLIRNLSRKARRSVDGDHPDNLPASEDPSRSGGKASGSDGDPRSESPSSERAVPTSATRKGVQSEGSLSKRARVKFPDRVDFMYDEKTPLVFNPLQCAELTRQIRGGTRELPPIGDLYFKDKYIDAAFTRKRKYDSALKQTMIQLGAAEKLARTRLSAIERLWAENKKANDKAAEEKEVLRVKFEELECKLKSDRLAKKELMRGKTRLEQTAAALEKEKAKLEEKRDAVVETLVKEKQRLKDSRIQEVTRERVKVQTAMADKSTRCFGQVRDHLARLDAFQKAKNLYGQASGMRKCLEVIRDNGRDILQEMINIFIEQEKLHEAEVAKFRIDPLSESDPTLSPLNLPSRFVNEEFMATLDPYGSNVGLIRSESASQLITSREVVEDQSRELAVDVTSAPTEWVAATEEKSPEKENPETGDVLIQKGGTEVRSAVGLTGRAGSYIRGKR
ncbi:hypothetical protein Bca52824_066017 [Brassica carinata]|uniref:Uncharacterized protein n=1 Tax=Brassica carinata TaxID=52824 RepID=A0A8X7QJU3_BRACI|nr:hypothetical protein Bca52824_066017 [Brassica carinata]